MKNYPMWKSILVLLVVSLGIIFAIPTLIYKEESKNWFLQNTRKLSDNNNRSLTNHS